MAAPTYYFARSAHSGGQSITTASPAEAKQVAQGLANRVGGKVTLYKYTNGKPRKAGTFVGKVANPPRNKWVSGVVKNRAGKVVARGPIMVTSKGEIKAKVSRRNPAVASDMKAYRQGVLAGKTYAKKLNKAAGVFDPLRLAKEKAKTGVRRQGTLDSKLSYEAGFLDGFKKTFQGGMLWHGRTA